MKKMYEKKNVLFYVFPQKNGNYVVDVLHQWKNVFRIFFHLVINFINETNYNNIL